LVGIALPHYARLMVSFHDNLGKPVPECLTIVGFSAARDHGVGDGGDNWNFATLLIICTWFQSNHHHQQHSKNI